MEGGPPGVLAPRGTWDVLVSPSKSRGARINGFLSVCVWGADTHPLCSHERHTGLGLSLSVMQKGSCSSGTGGGGTYRRSWRAASSWAPHASRAGGRPIQGASPRAPHTPCPATRPPACLPLAASAAVAAAAAAAKTKVEKRTRKHFSWCFFFFSFPLSLFKPGENESAATLLVQNK